MQASGYKRSELDRVDDAGGSIALPKTAFPHGMGTFAHIIDSEGGRIGLHSPSV